MDPSLLEALLSTASDDHLSRGERRALKQVLRSTPLHLSDRHRLRDALIRSVQERVSPRDQPLVDWLGDALRLLDPPPVALPKARAWFGPRDPMVESVVQLLDAVRERVDIAVFTITDNRVTERILALHRRGVRVRVLTDDDKAHDRGSDVDQLRRSGVPLRVDNSPHHFHHKFAVLDGQKLLNGSYNWTRGADTSNRENFLLTFDVELVRAYAAAFEQMWGELS